MRTLVTTLLDVLGLLLLASGVVAAVAMVTGIGPALGVGGLVVLVGSWLSGLADRPKKRDGGGSR